MFPIEKARVSFERTGAKRGVGPMSTHAKESVLNPPISANVANIRHGTYQCS